MLQSAAHLLVVLERLVELPDVEARVSELVVHGAEDLVVVRPDAEAGLEELDGAVVVACLEEALALNRELHA